MVCCAIGGPIAGLIPCLTALCVRQTLDRAEGRPADEGTALLATCSSLASATISRIPLTDAKIDLTNRLVTKPEPISRSLRCPVATIAAADFYVVRASSNARKMSSNFMSTSFLAKRRFSARL
jgi:hypothetical protein